MSRQIVGWQLCRVGEEVFAGIDLDFKTHSLDRRHFGFKAVEKCNAAFFSLSAWFAQPGVKKLADGVDGFAYRFLSDLD